MDIAAMKLPDELQGVSVSVDRPDASVGHPQPFDSTRFGFEHTGRSRRAPTNADEHVELALLIGVNLRRFRKQRGLSLEQLGRQCKVSRAMLGQVELGRSVPTVTVLWRIAQALEVQVASFLSAQLEHPIAFIPAGRPNSATEPGEAITRRALFPDLPGRRIEIYELVIPSGVFAAEENHPPGTTQYLVVQHGEVEMRIDKEVYRLSVGDALMFPADESHRYENRTRTEARAYSVVTFLEPTG